MKRNIGDKVRINPYSQITGVIIGRKDASNENCGNFDYKVRLNIHNASKDTFEAFGYTFCYDSKNKYWWQFFNDDELDILERNYELVVNN